MSQCVRQFDAVATSTRGSAPVAGFSLAREPVLVGKAPAGAASKDHGIF